MLDRTLTAALVLLALASPSPGRAAAPGAAGPEVIDRVLAVVGGRVITLTDARAAVEFGFVTPRPASDPVSDALAYLVNRQLMLSEVDHYSAPTPAAAAVERRTAEIRARFRDGAAWERALARNGTTFARLRDLVMDDLRIGAYLDQRFSAAAQPTSEEVSRYYHDHAAEFTRDGRLLPFEQVQAQAESKVMTERRNALIAEWLDRLRRRLDVRTSYAPAG